MCNSPIRPSYWVKHYSKRLPGELEEDRNIMIREELENGSPRYAKHRAPETDGPLDPVQPGYAEGVTSDEYDKYLPANHQSVDHHEPVVAVNAFKYVELVV